MKANKKRIVCRVGRQNKMQQNCRTVCRTATELFVCYGLHFVYRVFFFFCEVAGTKPYSHTLQTSARHRNEISQKVRRDTESSQTIGACRDPESLVDHQSIHSFSVTRGFVQIVVSPFHIFTFLQGRVLQNGTLCLTVLSG